MARVINGLISGKVGDMVYYIVDGVQFARKAPGEREKSTAPQVYNNNAFGLTSSFLAPYRSLLERTWTGVSDSRSKRYHAAFSFVRKNVIEGGEFSPSIRYDRLLVSKGVLDPALSFELTFKQNIALLTWLMQADCSVNCSPDDKVTFLLINQDKTHYMLYEHASKRADLRLQITVPEAFKSDIMHGYMFFTDFMGRNVSDSSYLRPVYENSPD